MSADPRLPATEWYLFIVKDTLGNLYPHLVSSYDMEQMSVFYFIFVCAFLRKTWTVTGTFGDPDPHLVKDYDMVRLGVFN